MKLYRVKGNSMYPFLRDDDFVVVKKLPVESFRKCNLLVFEGQEGGYIIHRIVKKINSKLLLMRGDAYELKTELVATHSVKGRVIGIIRNERFIRLSFLREWYSWTVSKLNEHLKRFLRRHITDHGDQGCLPAKLHNSQDEGVNLL